MTARIAASRRAVVIGSAVLAALLVAVAVALALQSTDHTKHAAATTATRSTDAAGQTPTTDPTGDGRPTSPPAVDPNSTRPVRIRIPSIGVDSDLQSLGITSSGVLQTPSRFQRAGWYSGGVRPGDTGPAVIAGHIDSTRGPAVFARLDELHRGATVLVSRADHSVLRFVVDSSQRYPKKSFPTNAVYGPSALPLLRLVTCTGTFDQRAHSYLDNLVVTTHLETS